MWDDMDREEGSGTMVDGACCDLSMACVRSGWSYDVAEV